MTAINALRTSVSGLNAQATKLSGISNNIANSSTVGYKRVDTQFESLVLEGSSNGASALAGTSATNRVEISKLGQVQSTGIDTDIAVNGNGFLVVNDSAGSNGKYLVTRAGSFRSDANGNLVNAGGYYLQGVKLGADGLPLGNVGDNNVDSLTTVNVNDISVASAPTTNMTFWANLPSGQTAYKDTPQDINTNISSIDYYDALGATQTLTYRFIPQTAASATDPNTNKWLVQVFDSATGGDPALAATDEKRLVGQVEIEFWGASAGANKAGTIRSVTDAEPTAAVTGSYSGYTPTADATRGLYDPNFGTLTMKLGGGIDLPIKIGVPESASGLTQLSGNYVPTKVEKDGSAFGMLERVSIEDDGKVVATFSNGQSRAIYQLKLAVFPNADGLNPVSGDAYEMSRAAGSVRLLTAGEGSAGTTSGGALESSNVDIGTELTNLIETQRAYSSNASVVRTADQMLEEATNLKR
ncbi:flagellar hook-basal body complex protein [Pseudoroseomonas wenyumeiae]|uniref:Flagellar hook protein FlgE n=1 Tax=Teichococcus wenyumeiae TaxID=2478470 RepID=A0A3A9J8M9_9PROT|nr:flagellar hook protein FlgE [Pseudoroseomonas wenyumeiae]RKK03637.1 flagellar hook protein FlgE [Pseudoroseomonas wenyumeiae]RMI20140.1 flagellar hook-basal body complex protein [Pseudoroseomonas wenyumeiae]